MNNHKPTIKVLQYMHGDFEYFHWSEKINRRYCERHGYEYVRRSDVPRIDRHVNWQRIPTILSELHDCDYLLFMDADAHFYSHELTVEHELIPLMAGKPILMAQDIACENERWTPGKPNAGVMLVKINDHVRAFFNVWDKSSDLDPSTCWQWPLEQLTLWNILMPKFPDMVHVHPDYYMIQGWYGQYIRHYMFLPQEERTQKIQQFCQTRIIDVAVQARKNGDCHDTP
jgi:hypothetical protein